MAIMTPKEFAEKVKRQIEVSGYRKDMREDTLYYHIRTDELMEDMLISLGYGEGIDILRKETRWYD